MFAWVSSNGLFTRSSTHAWSQCALSYVVGETTPCGGGGGSPRLCDSFTTKSAVAVPHDASSIACSAIPSSSPSTAQAGTRPAIRHTEILKRNIGPPWKGLGSTQPPCYCDH